MSHIASTVRARLSVRLRWAMSQGSSRGRSLSALLLPLLPLVLLAGMAARPSHAISAGQTVYNDLGWIGLSLRGTLSSRGVHCGPAIELGVHPVHFRTVRGDPPWLGEPQLQPLNDRAHSITAWAGLWGNGPDQLGVDLTTHWFRGMYPNRKYTPKTALVAGWMRMEDHQLMKLGGSISGGVPLNSTLQGNPGVVFPRGAAGAGVWLGQGANRGTGLLGVYTDIDVALRLIGRAE